MKKPDEQHCDKDDTTGAPPVGSDPTVRDRIERLVDEVPYAVLCVQSGGQPYGALVAFVFSDDLQHAVFATPVATRKYRSLVECDHVALVIDNRSERASELMEVEAVTATGRSQLIERNGEFDRWAALLVRRHPYLNSFLEAPSSALFRVDVVRFLHVMRFQEVRQWIPTDQS